MLRDSLQIIRWPNLLMLAGIQLLVFYRLSNHQESILSVVDLGLLILITMLIGAGGYVINDLYDSVIDQVNKPQRWIAGNTLSLKSVKAIYLIIVALGFMFSIWLAVRLGLLKFIFVYPIAVTGLWFYSYALKCKPFVGNIFVSFFCAAVVGIVFLPDYIFGNANILKPEFWFYLLFAFISTWFREVVKDIEDREGDSLVHCQTLVVRYGLKFSKWMSTILALLLIASLMYWDAVVTNHWVKLIIVVLQGFIVGSIAFVWWAKTNLYYHHASTIIKLVMAGGSLLLLLI